MLKHKNDFIATKTVIFYNKNTCIFNVHSLFVLDGCSAAWAQHQWCLEPWYTEVKEQEDAKVDNDEYFCQHHQMSSEVSGEHNTSDCRSWVYSYWMLPTKKIATLYLL